VSFSQGHVYARWVLGNHIVVQSSISYRRGAAKDSGGGNICGAVYHNKRKAFVDWALPIQAGTTTNHSYALCFSSDKYVALRFRERMCLRPMIMKESPTKWVYPMLLSPLYVYMYHLCFCCLKKRRSFSQQPPRPSRRPTGGGHVDSNCGDCRGRGRLGLPPPLYLRA